MDSILLDVVLPLSLAFIMFTLGLGLKLSDFTNIAKQPKAFLLGLSNQMVLLPIVGFLLASIFGLTPALAVGVMILALSPGGVTTNVLAKLGGGNVALSVSLTGIVTLISAITLPLILAASMAHFIGEAAPDFSILSTAITMFAITVVPVILGMVVTKLLPAIQAKAGKTLSLIAVILFAVIIIGALAANWEVFITNLPVLGPLLILLNIVMLGLGLWTTKLVGLSGQDGTTIAVESGVQNGTLSIAVATLVFAGAGLPEAAVPAAVYGITMYLVTVPFVIWRKRAAG